MNLKPKAQFEALEAQKKQIQAEPQGRTLGAAAKNLATFLSVKGLFLGTLEEAGQGAQLELSYYDVASGRRLGVEQLLIDRDSPSYGAELGTLIDRLLKARLGSRGTRAENTDGAGDTVAIPLPEDTGSEPAEEIGERETGTPFYAKWWFWGGVLLAGSAGYFGLQHLSNPGQPVVYWVFTPVAPTTPP